MKNLKMTLLAAAALLFASAPLQAAAPGQWSSSGFTQWHPQDGKRVLGSAGTQCFFCQADSAAPPPAKEAAAPAAPRAPGDADGDGVLDPDDKCPDTPKGAPVNKQGCWIVKNLNFRTNSAKIEPKDEGTVKEAAGILQKNPGLRVEIQGHTDSVGSNAYNKVLSNKRAHSVMASLVKQGVEKKRLTARGYGEEKPVSSNATAEGRAENRRVELHVLPEKAKVAAPAKKKSAAKKKKAAPVKKEAVKKAPAKKAAAQQGAAKPAPQK
ncbi:MAG: OmpA family protein [Magnetococcales bacterium]|nr:OmpA family protein [Magnetococcales bacterium]